MGRSGVKEMLAVSLDEEEKPDYEEPVYQPVVKGV